ncbi:hypothetical protein [Solidesulfovibrio sp. C21]|uniref:hypothetical protein n=1 Tax=Solidesulfovibrio sp. C21 TaxID=3398613 RepID=UPI0039FBD88B
MPNSKDEKDGSVPVEPSVRVSGKKENLKLKLAKLALLKEASDQLRKCFEEMG